LKRALVRAHRRDLGGEFIVEERGKVVGELVLGGVRRSDVQSLEEGLVAVSATAPSGAR
jgi:hypothetical protein